jgi:hypothetical protein
MFTVWEISFGEVDSIGFTKGQTQGHSCRKTLFTLRSVRFLVLLIRTLLEFIATGSHCRDITNHPQPVA